MLPDRVSNPGPLTYESGALPIALRGPELLPIKSTHIILRNLRSSGSHMEPQNQEKNYCDPIPQCTFSEILQHKIYGHLLRNLIFHIIILDSMLS